MTTTERRSDEQDTLADSPGEALRDAGQKLLGLLVSRASEVAMDRVDDLADRLSGMAEGGGPGLGFALRGGKALAEGKSPVRAALSAGFGGIKDKIKGFFGGGGGGKGKKLKVTNIVEETDIGLPLRVTYNLWTQFEDFPGFMKKVKSVEQSSEEKVNWKAQVFWSHRSWEATIVEQVPDSHIVWRSKGAKGHVNGAVTFTELGRNLTRVLLILEYYPQGLFERTGNVWRAQGRRARLEFKHFRRNAMADAILRQDEIEGWRGEIRDSEVVRTHEEALEQEREESGEDTEHTEGSEVEGAEDTAEAGDAAEDTAEDAPEDEDAVDEDALDEDAEDEDGEDYDDEDEYEDDLDDEADDEDDEYDDDLDEDEAGAEDDEYDDEDLDDDPDDRAGDGYDDDHDEHDRAEDDEFEPDEEPSDNGAGRRRGRVSAGRRGR
jgi:hypothetical protein